MRVPPVDPLAPRRLRKALLEPFALTRAGRWWVINVAPRIDGTIGRASGGRLTSLPGIPMLLLTHTGAKSGRTYVTPLLYFTDGPDEDVVVIASNYGRARHPAWLANVRANPEVRLQARGRGGRYRARVVADGPERDRLFGLAKQLTRAYADYERRTSDERTIAVVVCSPLEPASA
ncbi:MAG: nitroreductase family deazaflavin-dependent oxidoreductase [Actinobacteria bacterium]|nr:nitroreductase family deazaflavin-dependent oxidoreductase [Actinomycetota bacterium]